MPDAESRETRNRITADPPSVAAQEGARAPDRGEAESDAGPNSHSLSVRPGQSIALRSGNALVTRGLHEIPQLGNRARAKELVELGNACTEKWEFDEAISYFTNAIGLEPGYAEAYCARGLAHCGKDAIARGLDEVDEGELDKGIADYNEAIRVQPSNADFYRRRGSAYSMKGDYEQAVTDYTEVIRLDNSSVDAYVSRARAHHDNSDYRQAITDYTAAIRLKPKNALIYYLRGEEYYANDDYAKAIADYSEALRLNPDPYDSYDAYSARGRTYYAIGDCDEAIDDFTEAIRLAPGKYFNGKAYQNRGNAYLKKGDRAKAELDLAEARRLGYSAEPVVVSPERPPHRPTIRELRAAAEKKASAALQEFTDLWHKQGLDSNACAVPERESTAAESPEPAPPPSASPAANHPLPRLAAQRNCCARATGTCERANFGKRLPAIPRQSN